MLPEGGDLECPPSPASPVRELCQVRSSGIKTFPTERANQFAAAPPEGNASMDLLPSPEMTFYADVCSRAR